MKDPEHKLPMENLKFLIQLEKEKYLIAIMQQTELSVVTRMKANLTKLREELKILESKGD